MIDEIYNYRQGNLLTVPLSAEWEKLCITFEETLSNEQLTIFHKLCNLQSASAADDMRAAYKAGFMDGTKIMIEVHSANSK